MERKCREIAIKAMQPKTCHRTCKIFFLPHHHRHRLRFLCLTCSALIELNAGNRILAKELRCCTVHCFTEQAMYPLHIILLYRTRLSVKVDFGPPSININFLPASTLGSGKEKSYFSRTSSGCSYTATAA